MRDPYQIVRPKMFPQTHPCLLTSRGFGRLYPVHVHNAYPDKTGAGVTGISCSHFHRIRDWKILPDESDSHEHGLTNVRCGTGI